MLDIGCGAGRHVVFLGKRGYDMFGVDISLNGTKLAKELAAREGVKATVDVGDMTTLPYADGNFDAAISRGVITHATLDGVRKALVETARVLRRDGMFMCTFISTRSSMLGKGGRIDNQTWICDDPMEAGVVHHFMTEEDVRREVAPYFRVLDLYHIEHKGLIDNGRPYVSAHWVLEAARNDSPIAGTGGAPGRAEG